MQLLNTDFARTKANRRAIADFAKENHETLSKLARTAHNRLGRGYIFVPNDEAQVDYKTAEDAESKELKQLVAGYDPESEVVLFWQPKRVEDVEHEDLDKDLWSSEDTDPPPVVVTAPLHKDWRAG